jgi:hypothetical protein
MNESKIELNDPGWKSLCRIGGAAAWLFAGYSLLTILQVVVFGGPYSTVAECFEAIRENRLAGIIRLDVLTVFCLPLYYLIFLGFYAAFRRTYGAYAALGAALAFAGVTLVLASSAAISLVSLSDKYAEAATEAQRAQYLAAAEALFSSDLWNSTSSLIGGIMLQSSLLWISVLMLKSKLFSPFIAYVGLVTNGLDLARILIALFLPAASVYIMVIAGPLYLLWLPLVGRRLLQLGRAGTHH